MLLRGIVAVLIVGWRAVAVGAFTIDELPAESVYSVARIRIEGTATCRRARSEP
jgi:hypothetical protein